MPRPGSRKLRREFTPEPREQLKMDRLADYNGSIEISTVPSGWIITVIRKSFGIPRVTPPPLTGREHRKPLLAQGFPVFTTS